MSSKALVMIGMTVGSILGSYIPIIFGADVFSLWSIVGSAVGGIAGIWAGWKVANL